MHLRHVLRALITLPTLLLALWACTSHPLEKPLPQPEQETRQEYEANPIRQVDILFLIDNSPSMREEQDRLRANFPQFMAALDEIDGGRPDVHIGVVSSDLGILNGRDNCGRPGGDRGALIVRNTCGLDPNARFLVSNDRGRQNNFTGDIGQVFSCMAALGAEGCGIEHQLQAVRLALDERLTPENTGFLRKNAYLAIIVLTDEDDCSADAESSLFTQLPAGVAASLLCATNGHVCRGQSPPLTDFSVPLADCRPADDGKLIRISTLVDAIRGLKDDPRKILVSGIFGWPTNEVGALYRFGRNFRPAPWGGSTNLDIDFACTVGSETAATVGLRLNEFVRSFGENGVPLSICQDSFRDSMRLIGDKLRILLNPSCIAVPLADTRPAEPGLQPDCQVVDRTPMPGGAVREVAFPACSRSAPPCWRVTPDAMCGGSGHKIEVDRAGQVAAPGTQQSIRCLTCVKPDDPRCARP
jgi:hypothetical protein